MSPHCAENKQQAIKPNSNLLPVNTERRGSFSSPATNIHGSKIVSREQSVSEEPGSPLFFSVTKIWDVVIGVTSVTPGGVVGDSQMVEPGKENQHPYYDDGNGAVRVL